MIHTVLLLPSHILTTTSVGPLGYRRLRVNKMERLGWTDAVNHKRFQDSLPSVQPKEEIRLKEILKRPPKDRKHIQNFNSFVLRLKPI